MTIDNETMVSLKVKLNTENGILDLDADGWGEIVKNDRFAESATELLNVINEILTEIIELENSLVSPNLS